MLGVVNIAGVDVPESDILVHTFSNMSNSPNPDMVIR
jgi:hypothetical protein